MKNLQAILQNSKVILKPLQLSDEESLWPIAQEKELWVYGLKDLSVRENLHEYIQSAMRDREKGITAVWVIIDATTEKVAGCTRLVNSFKVQD